MPDSGPCKNTEWHHHCSNRQFSSTWQVLRKELTNARCLPSCWEAAAPKELKRMLCWALWHSLLVMAKNRRGGPFNQSGADNPRSTEKSWREKGRDAIHWFQPCYCDLWKRFQSFLMEYTCDFHPDALNFNCKICAQDTNSLQTTQKSLAWDTFKKLQLTLRLLNLNSQS